MVISDKDPCSWLSHFCLIGLNYITIILHNCEGCLNISEIYRAGARISTQVEFLLWEAHLALRTSVD